MIDQNGHRNSPKEFNSSPCLGTTLCAQFPLKGSFKPTCECKYEIKSLLCSIAQVTRKCIIRHLSVVFTNSTLDKYFLNPSPSLFSHCHDNDTRIQEAQQRMEIVNHNVEEIKAHNE